MKSIAVASAVASARERPTRIARRYTGHAAAVTATVCTIKRHALDGHTAYSGTKRKSTGEKCSPRKL
ncbi:MAG: hypothetical protein R3A52_31180 [Polyangiales bacterium]